MRKSLTVFLFIAFHCIGFAQEINPLIHKDDFENQRKWVDSVYRTMGMEEKIGQLFMVDLFSSDSQAKVDRIKRYVSDYHIGGIIFSKGGPVRQAKINNELQEIAKVPLLIGMDAEWGLAMRLDSTYAYPWNMTLGAIQDNAIVEEVGKRIGNHAKRLGVHFNYAPVVDINTNPKNPIIGNRSFGEDKENVTAKAIAFAKGMQRSGVLGSAKHFPGHGDTDQDSHNSLPSLDFSRARIDSLELYPYRQMIQSGISSIMIGHLNVPALEPKNIPSSLSYKVVTELLQQQMGFNGLVYTDALNMKGVTQNKAPGEVELQAFLAGNDILLIPQDLPKAIEKLKEAVLSGVITEKRLAHSVKKILYAKYKVGLNQYQPINSHFLVEELNTVHDDETYEMAMEAALTVVKNQKAVLPIRELDKKKIAYIAFGDDSGEIFLKELKKYASVTEIQAGTLRHYIDKLQGYNYVIVGLHKSNDNPWKGYKFTENERVWLEEIARTNNVILSVFARPYALADIKSTAHIDAVLMGYQNSAIAQQVAAQVIFGARNAKGKLPVTAHRDFPVNTGIEVKQIRRLQYGTAESVGMNSFKLNEIDSLVTRALKQKMFPGAQVLVARKGKVIYHKNFGHHEYDHKIEVTDTTMYDLASLTKILASVPLLMELVDKKELTINTTLAELLPEFKDSNKANATLKEMLSHYARFKPWIPFYRETLNANKKGLSSEYYSQVQDGVYNVQVADELYMKGAYVDSIYDIIKESDLLLRKAYKYSDLPYYLLRLYFEEVYQVPMETLIQTHYYESLGANYMTYLPLEKFPKENIPPTEMDGVFRNQKVQGHVHDQGAAMLGGVSGHAGLFANANDVAKMMQLFLWKGFYGGKRYFNPEVLDLFNTCYYCDKKVRRGIGFDKPQLDTAGPTCGCVSMTSFGHSGFTGTFAWADPEEEIVYVFLSNRTYPDANNNALIRSNLRSDIQEVIYDAIDF